MWYLKNRAKLIVALALVTAAVLAILYFYAGLDLVWAILIFFVVLLGFQMTFDNFYMRKMSLATNRALDMECDPESFLEKTKIMKKYIYRDKGKGGVICTLNMGAGLVCAGRYQEAVDLLKTIEDSKVVNGSTYALFLAHMANAKIGLERYDEAKEDLKILKTTQFVPGKRMYSFAAYKIRLRYGMQEGAEEFFQGVVESTSATNKEKTEAAFELGVLYEQNGEVKKAREMYKECSKIGNKMIEASKARDRLGRI